MKFNPAKNIQNLQFFGEFGGVNPSIEDSSTYTFLKASKMEEVFEKDIEGCYLYSRHWNPTNRYLSQALAKMENTASAAVTASGMAAITTTLLQLCGAGDEIICSRMVYGGTYAFLKNVAPRFGIKTHFVDITKLNQVEKVITNATKVIYCESVSNPLLEVTDIRALAKLSRKHGLNLVVDNTFTPMIISPANLGADIVIHSLTKFINGTSDTVAGAICASEEFIHQLSDVNSGMIMLLGPVMDSMRAASVLKNLHSLHVRLQQHSKNALYLATALSKAGIAVRYPGLTTHPQHELMNSIMNSEFGYGGMLVINMGTKQNAYRLMERMQQKNLGYLAVSLGFYKTLFSSPGSSTSSEIPDEERDAMGLSDGLVRISVGLDANIEETFSKMKNCMEEVRCIPA
ncbi:MAG TPA: aminotransferase class I/II-fold pyridoxal phosphate-dependent enzyme [Cyclobacteriaceae bacterium]|nr:aminotransferase class I/II-fold pyridoxal phosphate-dependent enzyme [Cyclobacteriaceae bacterium]HRJ83610.1 aminotransferase class I/II-fold pyridoxal phosphate-dependent enzyme [Cyclobacteriaceae bacterium]